MKELHIESKLENIEKVTDFINTHLMSENATKNFCSSIDVVIDEIYSNIVNYSKLTEDDKVSVKIEIDGIPKKITIQFVDAGIPYDPLTTKDPNVDAKVEERDVGGLGIFMVKKIMDDVHYEYKDNKNVLTLTKNFS